MTTSIVALDLSMSATGYAGPAGTEILSAPKTGTMPARIHALTRDIVTRLHRDLGVDGVVIVEDLPVARMPGSGGKVQTLAMLHGVVRHFVVEDPGHWHLVLAQPASLKKYATGKGNAGKSEVLAAAVRRLGYAGADDNEADALWLRTMALDAAGDPPVVMPQVNREALAKVDWSPLHRLAVA